MKIWLWIHNKWVDIDQPRDGYISMVYNAHPNLHFCYQADKPTYDPPKVTIQQAHSENVFRF